VSYACANHVGLHGLGAHDDRVTIPWSELSPIIGGQQLLPDGKVTLTLFNYSLGRRSESEEIAAVVRFLCGPGGGFITGQTIHVNGGALVFA
jgi:NAD(P)-dependent dehydrogenase (short-subunit alcohol dehydrogenase family)